jgi:hypothetical protein
MNPASSATHDPSRSPDGSPLRPRLYTPGFNDVLGDRRLMLENTNAAMAEQLRFKREFSDAVGFEVAIRQRIDELAPLHDPSVAIVRRVEWLGGNDGLALVSSHVAGRRLSEMFKEVTGPAFAFEFIRQLAPALAAIQAQGAGVAHGLLTPERIIVTREGRLVIVEQVLGSAFELLQLPASRLRSEFGLALPEGEEPVALDARLDVIQLGFTALSLLAGQRLDPAQYPDEIPMLLETHARVDSLAAAQLRLWLEGALQLNRRPFDRPFDTAQDAYEAFEELSQELGPHAPESDAVVVPFHGGSEADLPPVLGSAAEPGTDNEPEPEPVAPVAAIPASPPVQAPPAPSAKPLTPVREERPKPRPEAERPEPARQPSRRATIFLPMRASMGSLSTNRIRMILGGAAFVLVALLLFVFKPFASGPQPPVTQPVAATPPPVPASPDPPVAEPTFVGPLPDPARLAGLAAGTTDLTTTVKPGAESTPATPPPATEPPAPAAPTGRFGGVRVTSPIEFQVYENGNLVGSTAGPIAVTDGPHTFDLVNDALGYRTRQTVNVKPGQMSALTVTVPNGRVSINAVPWADVWVDGKPVGQTPIANLSLPIGPHEIVFRHPQFPDQRQTWMVKAEGTTMVSVKFQQ